MLLITITGRKSGKAYTTPVSYLRDGDTLLITSSRHRTWWRNLRGGAPVTVRLQAQDRRGWGEVIEDHQAVAEGLLAFLQKAPPIALRYYGVSLDPDGQPDWDDVERAAQNAVLIRLQLAGEPVTSRTPGPREVREHV
jgi:deazaflavin-dependent oxidoreductase (nitroreductase family)